MDIGAIGDLISNVGFPIVMVLAIGYLLYKEQTNHKEEIDRMVEAINNNTNALSKVETMITDFKEMLSDLKQRVFQLENDDRDEK